MKNKKNYIFIIFLFVFLFSGCSVQETLKFIDDTIGEQMSDNTKAGNETGIKKSEVSDKVNLKNLTYKDLTKEQQDKIDEWLKNNGYNRYGDSAGAMYTGGTPLFNEGTGETINRFEYILKNNPEVLQQL